MPINLLADSRDSHNIFLFVSLLLSIPIACLARSPAEDKVLALYSKYRQLLKQGRYQEATRYAEELVTAGEKAFGKDHPNVAILLNNLQNDTGVLEITPGQNLFIKDPWR